MLALALKIQPLLEARGATVFLTRPTEANLHLAERAAKTNLISLEAMLHSPYHHHYEVTKLMAIMENIINDFEKYAPIYFNFPFDWSFTREIHPDLERIFQLQAHPLIKDNFLFISLHSNATASPINPNISGADVYHMTHHYWRNQNYFTNYANEDRNNLFGQMLLDNIHALGISRREVKPGNWFVIREHNLPGVLVENGFHTNPGDRALLSSPGFLEELALAYEDAIVRYFRYIELR